MQSASLCSPTQSAQLPALNLVTRHVAHEKDWVAIATEPDLCRLGKEVVAFGSYCRLDCAYTASPNVKARCGPVFRVGDMIRNIQADGGAHIDSGTSLQNGYLCITEGNINCKVNGIPVARHDSQCRINTDIYGRGGARARLVTVTKSIMSAPAAAAEQVGPATQTSPRLEWLTKKRGELRAGQLNLDGIDEYINLQQMHAEVADSISKWDGFPGRHRAINAQFERGLMGFADRTAFSIGELSYIGMKSGPEIIQSLGPTAVMIELLEKAIIFEEIALGNVNPNTLTNNASKIASAATEHISTPWEKGNKVESVVGATLDILFFATGLLKGLSTRLLSKSKRSAAAASRPNSGIKSTEAGMTAAKTDANGTNKSSEGVFIKAKPDEDEIIKPILFKNQFPEEKYSIEPVPILNKDQALRTSGKVLYVVKEDGTLVIAKTNADNLFGHFDLAKGEPIIAGGEAKIYSGTVKFMDNASGHYVPSGATARNAALKAFKDAGFAISDSTYVEKIYDFYLRKWVPK